MFLRLLLGGACLLLATSVNAGDLFPPVRIEAGGQPIDVKMAGHAAPFFGDINGDGLNDLLVRKFHQVIKR